MSRSSMFEMLESRTFLSAAPILFNATLKADRAVVRAELATFRSNLSSTSSRLNADVRALRRNGLAAVPGATALLDTLKTDTKAQTTALKEDRLTEAANALTDEATIKLDIRQILKDKGNAPAETADHAKLFNDRAQLQTDLIAGIDTRIATRNADLATLTTDISNIVTAITADTTASAKLVKAANKFESDKTTRLAILIADLKNIASARATLAADLTAAGNT